MSELKKPEKPDQREYGAVEIGIDSPVSLTVEGSSGELLVKCFQGIAGSTQPLQMNLRFTNEAFAQLASGIVKLIERGHIELNEGKPKITQ